MTPIRTTLLVAASLAISSCAAPAGSSSTQNAAALHGVEEVRSQKNFDSTVARLQLAIEKRQLNLFQVIDHGAGAQRAGLPLGKSKLFLFGNPKVGTQFMQADPMFGLDLPMKALVFEKDGEVYNTTTDIDALAVKHGVEGLEPVRAKVRQVLAGIAAEAAQ